MEDQFFIRMRGRVQGPFSQEHLQTLVRRGQFGRLHEVSEDGTNWVRASNYPELFNRPDTSVADETKERAHPAAEERNAGSSGYGLSAAPGGASRSATDAGNWYYSNDGKQHGPIHKHQLLELARLGKVDDQTLVWTDGMADWMPASQVDALAMELSNYSSGGLEAGGPTLQSTRIRVSEAICQSLMRTRPWVLLVGSFSALTALATLLWAILVFIQAGKLDSPILAMQGAASLTSALVSAASAYLLLRYAGRINALLLSRGTRELQEALEAQRLFWTFTGLILVLSVAFVVLFFVVVLIIGTASL